MNYNPNATNKDLIILGIGISVILFAFAIFQYSHNYSVNILLISLACLSLILAIFFPKFFIPINFILRKFGSLIGYILTPALLLMIFLASVLPTSMILKVFRKDILGSKIQKSKKSYWVNKEDKKIDFDNQF